MAINLLKERYGNNQEVVDLHYSKLINIPPPKNRTDGLRHFLDTVEKHLMSLEVLEQNIKQDLFISMIKSKLPKDVFFQMELRKDPDTEWTVESLRKCFRSYIVTCERAEQDSKQEVSTSQPTGGNVRNNPGRRYEKPVSSIYSTAHSAEALVVTAKGKGYSDKCRYCEKHQWSDECTN